MSPHTVFRTVMLLSGILMLHNPDGARTRPGQSNDPQ